jgi:hypothetical protein
VIIGGLGNKRLYCRLVNQTVVLLVTPHLGTHSAKQVSALRIRFERRIFLIQCCWKSDQGRQAAGGGRFQCPPPALMAGLAAFVALLVVSSAAAAGTDLAWVRKAGGLGGWPERGAPLLRTPGGRPADSAAAHATQAAAAPGSPSRKSSRSR